MQTGKDPVPSNAPVLTSAVRSSLSTTRRNLLHVRALLRIAYRRQSSAVILGAASLTAAGALAATAAVYVAHDLHAVAVVTPVSAPKVLPLAPHPSSKPRKHRLLASSLRGAASWYGAMWQGRRTASGEIFDDALMTACHRTLPFGTLVRVTDLHTAKSVIVRINDRGALTPERVIDLSSGAAQELGILTAGVASVRLEVLGRVRPVVAQASIVPPNLLP